MSEAGRHEKVPGGEPSPPQSGPPIRALARHVRYGFATLGPVAAAGAQFVLSVRLLHALSPFLFGSFSFLLIASQLSTGLSSALFCAPLPILLSQGDEDTRRSVLRCLLAANLCLAACAFAVFYGVGAVLQVPTAASLLFAGYATLMLLRWFARAYAYVADAQWRTVTSDLTYGAVLLCSVVMLGTAGGASLSFPCAGLLVAAALSLLPFGRLYLGRQFLEFSPRDLSRYGQIWRVHSSWSLTGVLTTEATANAHAYIVTLFSGPTEFARVAASALLIRPIGVAMNALAEFERPQMARQLTGGAREAVSGSIRFFRYVLIAVWAATAIVSALLMIYAPRLMFPAHYKPADMTFGAILWLVVAGVRLLRTPESTLLQAAGRFRPLAYASVISSGVSILAVAVFLAVGGPIWSVVGILLGEAIFAFAIFRQARRWQATDMSSVDPAT
jgi:O-antigen/teichoic acid export membrane protein